MYLRKMIFLKVHDAIKKTFISHRSAFVSMSAIAFAREGPMWPSTGSLAPEADWLRHGAEIVAQLAGDDREVNALPSDSALAARVYHLYLPVYFFCRDRALQQRGEPYTPIIGLSAPQGCGKTTLVKLLTDRFAADGLQCAAVSFDDFYLRGEEQDAVAAAHRKNELLQVRGNAGTHDLSLGEDTLLALCGRVEGGGGRVLIPRYDKAARNGRGDRAPQSEWSIVERRPDVVLLEGWMAGFGAVDAGEMEGWAERREDHGLRGGDCAKVGAHRHRQGCGCGVSWRVTQAWVLAWGLVEGHGPVKEMKAGYGAGSVRRRVRGSTRKGRRIGPGAEAGDT